MNVGEMSEVVLWLEQSSAVKTEHWNPGLLTVHPVTIAMYLVPGSNIGGSEAARKHLADEFGKIFFTAIKPLHKNLHPIRTYNLRL